MPLIVATRRWSLVFAVVVLALTLTGRLAWAQAETTALRLTDAASAAATEEPAPPANEATEAEDASDSAFVSFFRRTELSALADMYFSNNFNEPDTGAATPLRNFDSSHNQFSFGLAELALSKPAVADARVGFRLDLDYGEVARTVNSFDPAGRTLEYMQQAYISYLAPVGTGLTLDVGKFVTPVGAEVIESKDNWNYSRSLLFALAIPYYHLGARLAYSPADKVTLGGSITNGWNDITDNNSQKTVGVSATLKPVAPVSLIANFMAGPEQAGNADDWRRVFDLTLTYAVTDTFSVMGNYDHGTDSVAGESVTWQGVALYARAQATGALAFSPRFEVYRDDGGFTTGLPQTVKELTLTGELKHSHGLLVRAEFRRDWSDQDFFASSKGPVDGQNTFTVGLVYSFSTKAP